MKNMGLPNLPIGPFQHLSAQARCKSMQQTLAQQPVGEEIWLFGYGSLIWRPGFEVSDRCRGRLHGFERCFSVFTVEARGTPDQPGLGLGLERTDDGCCDGVLLKLPEPGSARDQALTAIWEREMWTGVYQPLWLPVQTANAVITALVFVVDPQHPQYAGHLTIEEQAYLIKHAVGKFGSCRDYLEQTVAALSEIDIDDQALIKLLECLQSDP